MNNILLKTKDYTTLQATKLIIKYITQAASLQTSILDKTNKIEWTSFYKLNANSTWQGPTIKRFWM